MAGLRHFHMGQMYHWAINDASRKRVRDQPYLTSHPTTGQPCVIWLMMLDRENMYGHVYYRPTNQFMDVVALMEKGHAEIDELRSHCAAWAEGTLENYHGRMTMRMDSHAALPHVVTELRDAGKINPAPQQLVAEQIEASVA